MRWWMLLVLLLLSAPVWGQETLDRPLVQPLAEGTRLGEGVLSCHAGYGAKGASLNTRGQSNQEKGQGSFALPDLSLSQPLTLGMGCVHDRWVVDFSIWDSTFDLEHGLVLEGKNYQALELVHSSLMLGRAHRLVLHRLYLDLGPVWYRTSFRYRSFGEKENTSTDFGKEESLGFAANLRWQVSPFILVQYAWQHAFAADALVQDLSRLGVYYSARFQ